MLNGIHIARGIAAILVVCAHANLMADPNLFGGILIIGWCGVDFFFVLSGFIIYYSNSKYIGSPKSFSKYLKNRFQRLFPIYWIYSILALSIHCILFTLISKKLITWADISVQGIALDAILWPSPGLSEQMPILPVAWTLSYELLFYGLFSLAILLGRQVALVIAALWLSLIVLTATGLVTDGRELFSFPLYVVTDLRNAEFLLGCLAGHIFMHNRKASARHGLMLLTIGFTLLALAWANAANQFIFWPRLEAVQFGVPFFLIVLGLALSHTQYANKIAGPFSRVGIYLGDASYSIYLIHFIAVVVLTRIAAEVHLPSLLNFGIAAGGAMVLGLAGYRWIERPLLQRMRKLKVAPELSGSHLPE